MSGGKNGNGGLTFDDSVAKGSLDSEYFSASEGSSSNASGGFSSSGTGAKGLSAKGKDSNLDSDFFNNIAAKEKKKNRNNRSTKLTSRPAPPGRNISSRPNNQPPRGSAATPPASPSRSSP
jgi:hypothetical protein